MAENNVESLQKTVQEKEKVISLAKELVELILKNCDSIDDLEIIHKAESLSCNNHIMMARYP